MMDNQRETFRYRYAADEQEEIKMIREKYLPREESGMERLRKLDKSVTKSGVIASLALGVISCLVMGVGMCCCMVWGGVWFIPGVIIGIVGLIGITLTYPLYIHIIQKRREKLAPEILRLIGELMKR